MTHPMRILFIQVPTSHLGAGERVYPLGLSRLSGIISGSVETVGLDMNLSPDPWPELMDKVALISNPPAGRMAMDDLPGLDTRVFNPRDYLAGNKYIAAIGIEGKRGCDLCCRSALPHLL
jgi:hypothetical protein